MAITTIFGTIANGRYELAIIASDDKKDIIPILALGLIINFFISFFLFLLILLFNDIIIFYLKNDEVKPWLYWIPVAIFIQGIFNLLYYLNLKKNSFSNLRDSAIIKSASLSSVQVFLGFIKHGAAGLIIGEIISRFTANFILFKNLDLKLKTLFNIPKQSIFYVAKKYKDFPKFSMSGTFLNVLSSNSINLLIPVLYNSSILGFFSLAQRSLGAPLVLIGEAIGSVFIKEASDEKKRTGKSKISFNSALLRLLFIGGIIFLPLYFIVVDLFSFVFGTNWISAGIYAKYLIPLFFAKFVVGSLSNLYLFEKQKIGFVWQLLLFIISIFSLIFGKLFFVNFEHTLILFSFLVSMHYFILFIIIYKINTFGKL